MRLIMENIYERDIDLLLLRSFMHSLEFVRFFLNKAQQPAMDVVSVQHSLMTQDGESDVTVILKSNTKRLALLIEDKIDASAMPQQHYRYHLRGQQGIREGLYDEYVVFIVAPKAYLAENLESKLYENRISYEELLTLFDEHSFERMLLEEAIKEKQKSYTPIEDSQVTAFWQHFYRYCAAKFPSLSPYVYEGPRGSNAVWPAFRTGIPHTIIQHKSNHGHIDLEISGYTNQKPKFIQTNQHLLDDDMSIEKAGKSLAIRLKVPTVDFHQPFSKQITEIDQCMQAAIRLQKTAQLLIINKEENIHNE